MIQRPRAAFTLFELIIAIALAATLLALIGTAVNLYLTRVDRDRTRVEEAQLARSVLTMIADDIRATTVYQKQDTSAIAALMAAGTPYDTDDFDKARTVAGGAGAPGTAQAIAKLSSSGSGASSSGSKSSGSSATGGSGGTGGDEESDDTTPLGLTGSDAEVYIDATRLPRQEDLFATVTGYTNAPSAAASNPGGSGSSTSAANVNPPIDLKTVHYYVRPGNAVDSANAIAPEAQAGGAGLVREEMGRRMRVFAEQSGTANALSGSAALIAPEVTQIQFQYYDGTQLTNAWDMKQLKKLPKAIQVTIWIRDMRDGTADPMAAGRVYKQVVQLPMALASEASSMAEASAESGAGASGTSSGSSSSASSSSSSGISAFGDE